MTPFETFFATSFDKMLSNAPDEKPYSCPTVSIQASSWDRKAAFVIWDLLGRPGAAGSDSTIRVAPFTGGGENDTRYWYHPESDCLFTTAPQEIPFSDGLVEEIDERTYGELKVHKDHYIRFAMSPVEGGADEPSFEI